MATVSALNRVLRPMWIRIQLMVGRFVVTAINENPKLRTLQLSGLSDEILEGVEYFQHYGFGSHPKTGAEAIGVFVSGVRDHGIVIATADRRFKVTLSEGEVVVHDDLGQKVHLTRTGIVIDTPLDVTIDAGGDVTIDAGGDATVEAGGDAKVKGVNVVIEASGFVDIGGLGGLAVCRIGDADSNGDTMVAGSTKVRAV